MQELKEAQPAFSTLASRLKEAAARHGERAMAEVPATLKKLRLFLTVVAITVPLFLLGLLVIVAMALRVHV